MSLFKDMLDLVTVGFDYSVCLMLLFGQQEGHVTCEKSCCNNSQKFMCGLTSPAKHRRTLEQFASETKIKIISSSISNLT